MLKVRLVFPLGLAFLTTCVIGTPLTETFSSDPSAHGWRISGQTNLFEWDVANETLRVTWDSSQANSYFYHSLGTVVTRYDDFGFKFDLRLDDIGAGRDTNKASSFPIAVGLLNLDEATTTNFVRGTGADSPDLAELSYFWDSGFGATTWPVLVDTNSSFNFSSAGDYALFALTTGEWYHVVFSYSVSNQTLVATVTNAQNNSGVRITQPINSTFGDFRLGSFSVSSYTDAGQEPQFAGSVLAHGVIDNVEITVPEPPIGTLAGLVVNKNGAVQFSAQTNWTYTLESTMDFRSWTPVGTPAQGLGTITLSDTNVAQGGVFYRVRASRAP